MATNPKMRTRRFRRRYHVRSLSDRTTRLVSAYISDNTYRAKNLKELRTRFRAVVNNNQFWKDCEEMAKITKRLGKFANEF